MAENELKKRIKEVAVEHFNANGFYGTTIRNIANDVNCSLPMIYYYYKNKKELFDEIIKNEFFGLIKKQASLLKIDNVVDFYTDFIFGLTALNEYDKQVYRLGVKVYLSFDGDEELRQLTDEWEKSVLPRHQKILQPYLKNEDNAAVANTLIHLLETLIIDIVVKNRNISRGDIRREISVVLQNCL